VVNLLILAMGLELPPGGYADKKYIGMSAEQVYPLLPKDDDAMSGIGRDLRDVGSMDEAARRALGQRIDNVITQAVIQAKRAGNMPAQLARLVQGILHPPINWARLLADYMTRLARDETSWNRRNRRYSNIYMPGRHSVSMGEFTIIGDTSGSMQDKVFSQIGVELAHVRDAVRPSLIRVVWADKVDCSAQQVFEHDDIIDLKPKGGGGTDMRLPLKYIEQFDPSVGILVTDAETPWPTVPTPYPLIIVCTTNKKCPPWADVVRINN
jgi:predicted metal-dependent peptidase